MKEKVAHYQRGRHRDERKNRTRDDTKLSDKYESKNPANITHDWARVSIPIKCFWILAKIPEMSREHKNREKNQDT